VFFTGSFFVVGVIESARADGRAARGKAKTCGLGSGRDVDLGRLYVFADPALVGSQIDVELDRMRLDARQAGWSGAFGAVRV